MKLTFELALDSDYHIGAGQRDGPLVDSALLRDYDYAPLLRGTVLAGLLRDGLGDLLEVLPNQVKTKLKGWVEDEQGAEIRLFGSPARRKRWAYSSARPVGTIGGKKIRWGAQNVTRVRINPRTRRAEPHQLFSQEEGDARLVFHFTATCYGATEQDVADGALLVAAARMVRHLGSARRRGRGECRLTLIEAEGFSEPKEGESWLDHALNEFKTHWLESIEPPAKGEPVVEAEPAPSLVEGSALRFRIIARAKEPILIARRSEAANALETLPFIPGTSLLGALATRAARMLRLDSKDDAPDEFVTLFARGGVRTSGLLPAVKDEEHDLLYSALPTSPALFSCEVKPHYTDKAIKGHPLHDALDEGVPQKDCQQCGAKMKPLTSKFLTLQPSPHSYNPPKREEMHIRMNRQTGRVESGNLYEYIALEAGQWFVGELDCANDASWQRLQTLTGLTTENACYLRLGKASQRGYGLIQLVLEKLDDDDPSPLILQPLEERIEKEHELRVMLLTDAIVLDPWGRFYAGFKPEWVANALGISADSVQISREFVNSRQIDSFNTHRRMPRWRDQALVGGSTAKLHLTTDGWQELVTAWYDAHDNEPEEEEGVSPQLAALRWKVEQIEKKGIGVRRHEGFGRVVFNHPISMADCELDEEIGLELPEALQTAPGNHKLEVEANFGPSWEDILNKSQREDKRWNKITAAYLPLARLLFLSHPMTPENRPQWLMNLGQPSYLWGKKIDFRDKKSKIEAEGIKLIEKLVKQLENRAKSNQEWHIGISLLAERIVLVAEKNKSGGKK